jgi:hypothetical protein
MFQFGLRCDAGSTLSSDWNRMPMTVLLAGPPPPSDDIINGVIEEIEEVRMVRDPRTERDFAAPRWPSSWW